MKSNDSRGAMCKWLVAIVLIITTVAPALVMTAATDQSQQTSIPTREVSPATTTYWARTYGGGANDFAYSAQQTSDGGYIVAGVTGSFGAGEDDVWVLKLSSTGSVDWQKTYGGTASEWASSVQQTSDGGYIVAGNIYSFDPGDCDVWILRLNSTGGVTWQKTYGGGSNDLAYSVQQTPDGGFTVAAGTYSFGTVGSDVWVFKLNSTGSVVWQKTYGGTGDDGAYSAQQTNDGGCVVTGYTNSFGAGQGDAWVLKLNSTGSVDWQKTYGGTANDGASFVRQASDGGYVVAGLTDSYGAGGFDVWVLKLDSNGSVVWQKTYGASRDDYAYSVQQTSDGGYIVAAKDSYSLEGAGENVLVLKLDSAGGITWQKSYGGIHDDGAYSVQQISDGGYIVAAQTYSFGAGQGDAWVLRLDSDGSLVWNEKSGALTLPVNVVSSDSSATVSTTSVTPVSSDAAVHDTQVAPLDTQAVVKVQAGAGGTPQEVPTLVVVGVAGVVAAMVVPAIVVAMPVKKKPRLRARRASSHQS